MTTERRLGPIGTRMLFENDRVRVWEVRLAPGEEGAVHRHQLDCSLYGSSGKTGRYSCSAYSDSWILASEFMGAAQPKASLVAPKFSAPV